MIIEWLTKAVITAGIVFAVATIFWGCAPAVRSEICYEKFMASADDGLNVVAHICMSPEAFAEGQK